MLTFIIPFLVGTIVGFLIRGKLSDTFAITTGKKVSWVLGIALIGTAIVTSTMSEQMTGLIGFGLGFGLFNVLSIENAAYRKWSEGHALAWLVGGLSVAIVAWYFLTKNVSEILDRVAGVPDGTTSIHMSPEAPARSTDSVARIKQRAEQGDAVAQGHLELKYSLGHEVAKNDVEAVKWYRLAADQGNAYGQLNLGRMYAHGAGVARDIVTARNWWWKAVSSDDESLKSYVNYAIGEIRYAGEEFGSVDDMAQAKIFWLWAGLEGLWTPRNVRSVNGSS